MRLSTRISANIDGRAWSVARIDLDAAGRVRAWEGAAEAIFGWTADEANGRTLHELELVHADEAGWVAATLRAIADGRMTLGGFCQRNFARGGVPRYGEWTYAASDDHDGESGTRIHAHVIDRTGFFGVRERERALRLSAAGLDAQRAREVRLGLLGEFEQASRGLSEPRAIVMAGMELLRTHLGADRCAWADVEDDGNHFTFAGAAVAAGVADVSGRFPISAFGSAALEVMRAGATFHWSGDAEGPPGADASAYAATGIRALVAVPILRGGRLVAGTGVHMLTPRAWTPDDLAVIEAVTGRCAEAIERGRAQQALRESEERFRLASVAVNGLVFDWDRATGLVWRSEGVEGLVGFRPEECGPEADWWSRRVHPADLPRLLAFAAEIERPDGPLNYEVEYRVQHRDGHYVPVWERAAMLRDAEGKVTRVVGTTTDITARKRTEAALQESETRFRALADAAPVLIWTSDTSAARTWFNRTWLEFTGRSTAQEQGGAWVEGVHPDDRDRCLTIYHEAFRRREEYRTEYRLRRHDGVYRWLLVHGVARLDPQGNFLGYIGCCSDITDSVWAREALAEHGQHLERLVAERTQELERSHQRLLASERLASMGTLSAGLGHDLGNLLLPVQVRLATLERMGLPPAAREEIEAIRAAADYLQRLTVGLRLLAVDPERQPAGETTKIAAWWEDTQRVFRNALPRGVELAAQLPPEPCAVAMSRAGLTQAVFNLLQNAGDATHPQPDPKVSIEVVCRGGNVHVTVRDNGTGMSEEVRRRCMEPFFSTKTRGLSTGLGLALVYGLTRDAGGSVEIDTGPDRGTAVTLILRAAGDAAAPRRHAMVRLEDPRVRGFVRAELDSLGFDVVDAAHASGTDLLVTDRAEAAPPGPRGNPAAMIVLTDEAVPFGAIAVGRRPRVQDLRRLIHEAARPVPASNVNANFSPAPAPGSQAGEIIEP